MSVYPLTLGDIYVGIPFNPRQHICRLTSKRVNVTTRVQQHIHDICRKDFITFPSWLTVNNELNCTDRITSWAEAITLLMYNTVDNQIGTIHRCIVNNVIIQPRSFRFLRSRRPWRRYDKICVSLLMTMSLFVMVVVDCMHTVSSINTSLTKIP